ncbi:MAG: PTS sugar transporter subunit IIB [Promicromonosporaceae bacterium]|nr:PTS sugar transporter subunit IIB [Promicromonosporaceae bacterium]
MKKIVAVCGQGIGTSVLLKMNAEKVLRKLDSPANVEAADLQKAKTAANKADILLTTAELAEELKHDGVPAEVVVINNFTNLSEIESKLAPLVK